MEKTETNNQPDVLYLAEKTNHLHVWFPVKKQK